MSNLENAKFKYDLNDFIECKVNGKKEKIYRIVANRNIANPHCYIKQGDKGGYCMIGALSTEGESWIDYASIVGKDCHISGNAFVSGSVLSHDVFVGGNAQIFNSIINPGFKASVFGNSEVGSSKIEGDLSLKDHSIIEGCNITGRVAMEGENELISSTVKTSGNGICFVGGKKIKNSTISGKGTVGISDEIKIHEKDRIK